MKKGKIIGLSVVAFAFLFLISVVSATQSLKLKEDIGRIDFVHYAKNNAGGKPTASTCYSIMGVKWQTLPVNYVINPLNSFGISNDFVISAISSATSTWDTATSKNLFNTYSVDYSAQYGVQDNKNSIVFGDYPDANAIAVTSIWYSKKLKQIIEFDMIFNSKFIWGNASINPYLMDLQNIATHEFGHSIGLNDIYSESCSLVTMYGYSYEGDLLKSSLEQADILGLQKIYGI